MKKKLIDGLLFIGVMATFPIWVIFVIIIMFKLPNDYESDADHYYL